MSERTDALLNGIFVALGAAAILDNLVSHWLLDLHRVAPGPWATPIEVVLVVLGCVMVAVGTWRETRARSRRSEGGRA